MLRSQDTNRAGLTKTALEEKIDDQLLRGLAEYSFYPQHLRNTMFRSMEKNQEHYRELKDNKTAPYWLIENEHVEAPHLKRKEELLRRKFEKDEVEKLLNKKLSVTELAAVIHYNLLTRSQVEQLLEKHANKNNIAHGLLAQKELTLAEAEMLFANLTYEQKWIHVAYNTYLDLEYAKKIIEEEDAKTRTTPYEVNLYVKTVFARFPELEDLYFEVWCKDLFRPKARNLLSSMLSVTQNLNTERVELLSQNLNKLKNGEGYHHVTRSLSTNPYIDSYTKTSINRNLRNRTRIVLGDTHRNRSAALPDPRKPIEEQTRLFTDTQDTYSFNAVLHKIPVGWYTEFLRGRAQDLIHVPQGWNAHYTLQNHMPKEVRGNSILYLGLVGNGDFATAEKMYTSLEKAYKMRSSKALRTVESILAAVKTANWTEEEQNDMFTTFLQLATQTELTVQELINTSAKLNDITVTEQV